MTIKERAKKHGDAMLMIAADEAVKVFEAIKYLSCNDSSPIEDKGERCEVVNAIAIIAGCYYDELGEATDFDGSIID